MFCTVYVAVGCQSTKISKYEVTNEEFRKFLSDVEMDSEFLDSHESWAKVSAHSDVMVMSKHYFSHPAFNDYPVVNVSLDLAKQYCAWMTSQKSSNKKRITYRLPTLEEYEKMFTSNKTVMSSDYYEDYTCRELVNLKYLSHQDSLYNFAADGAFFTNDVHKTKKVNGIYGLIGNVSEITSEGSIVGGNWDSLPSEVFAVKKYDAPDPRIGFRVVVEKWKR